MRTRGTRSTGDAAPRARAREARSILTRATGFIRDEGRGFDLTINVAGGCTLDCAYCYVPAIFRITRPDLARDWGAYVEVKTNAAELLRAAAARGKIDGKAIYLSSVTEPFLPAVEPVTRALLEALAARPPRRLVLQTHLHRVARHLDVLRALGPVVAVSMSVPTDSEAVRRRFEPKAPPIAKRLEALAALTDAGIEAYLTVAPMLPFEDPAAFARETLGIARAALFSPLHAPKQVGRAGTRDRAVALMTERERADWLDHEGAPQEVIETFRAVWGPERVLYDQRGFGRLARGAL